MPVMMFTTPGGKPAWSINFANLSRGAGPSSEAFNTTVQPAARAGANLTADKNIWLNTKTKLRSEWLNKLNDQNEEELEEALKIWWSPEVRMKMQMFKAMLAAKKNNSI